MNNPNRPNTATLLPDDTVLTTADIAELGIEEAPTDIGPSFEELATKDGGHQHG
jgi:hypothetical protein